MYQEMFLTAARLHGHLFVAIDGLDECERPERELILTLVLGLLKLSVGDFAPQVFLTSCAEKDIEHSLQHSTRLALKTYHLEHDIRSYVQTRASDLSEKFGYSAEMVQRIANTVADQPQGLLSLLYIHRRCVPNSD